MPIHQQRRANHSGASIAAWATPWRELSPVSPNKSLGKGAALNSAKTALIEAAKPKPGNLVFFFGARRVGKVETLRSYPEMSGIGSPN